MKEIRKSTFREIKSSLGRFMAIFSIIALGVGFFAGLKVTRDAMVFTVKDYLDRHGFYDLRLLSTLGYEEENVQAFRAREDVEAAEGAVSMDAVFQIGNGGQSVLKVCSLSEELNKVELVSGHLPAGSGQCVVDSNFFDESAVGSQIRLAEVNDEDTLNSFTQRTYTVVGTVQSPLYIQFERGSTSLGTGRIAGFVYLLPDDFDLDYYTEVYVRFAQDNPLYGEDYRSYMEAKKELWEGFSEEEAGKRYSMILARSEKELEDGKQELAEQRAQGEDELAKGKASLEEAKDKKILSGEEFQTFYEYLIDRTGTDAVQVATLLVLDTIEEQAEDGYLLFSIVTQEQRYVVQAFDESRQELLREQLNAAEDTIVRVYVSGDRIFDHTGEGREGVTLSNVWIESSTESELRVFMNGYHKVYPCHLQDSSADESGDTRSAEQGNTKVEASLADIRLDVNGVTDIVLKSDIITAKVLAVQEDHVEVEGYGNLGLSEH